MTELSLPVINPPRMSGMLPAQSRPPTGVRKGIGPVVEGVDLVTPAMFCSARECEGCPLHDTRRDWQSKGMISASFFLVDRRCHESAFARPERSPGGRIGLDTTRLNCYFHTTRWKVFRRGDHMNPFSSRAPRRVVAE